MLGLVASVFTYLCVESGFDWWWHLHSHPYAMYALSAAIVGFFVPILLPVALYVWGDVTKNSQRMRSAALLAQAAAVGWVLSSTLKVFTGRMQPEFYTLVSNVDNSHEWLFGFWRHGIFWGWPSSHTTVSVAIACVFAMIYRKNPFLVGLALVYGAYIALGVSVSIHWFSDALAGVIFGYVAARAVSRGNDYSHR